MSIVDYLVLVALDEENEYLLKTFADAKGGEPGPPRMIDKRLYSRNLLKIPDGAVTVVVMPVGRMGEAAMQAAVSDGIRTWSPRDIILIGIAGSFEPDSLKLGDVIVPSKIFGCTEGKKEVIDGKLRHRFRKTGDRAASALIDIVRAVVMDPDLFQLWHRTCREAVLADHPLAARLALEDPKVTRPVVHRAANDSIVSGGDVIASKEAAADLKEQVDPTIRAVEMESKGLFEALEKQDPKPAVLIVRGISDYADEKKAAAEKKFKDGWRRFSMQNATRLALAVISGRPVIDETYRALPGPVLNLNYASNSWERCAHAGVTAGTTGSTAMAFPAVVAWTAGVPQTEITVRATGGAGAALIIDQVIVRPAGEQAMGDPLTNQPYVKHIVGRSAVPKSLELFLALPSAPECIEVTLRDEFGREEVCAWQK